jgi:alkylation response protein AidB-like acyl-CoA dehydrogenase
MLTITRIHNSLSALGFMRRIIALANDYKERRVAFGKTLKDHPLHLSVLARLEKIYRGNLLFLLESASMLQQLDQGVDTSSKALLRLFTPVLKLFTAKDCMTVVSEGLEAFGGLGYMENSRLPAILRDA